MKPIVIGPQNVMAWTRASIGRLERWRGRGAVRLGAVAGASLRTWLLWVATAAALAGVAAAAVHLLLLAALRSGAGLGWLAVAAVSAVAVVLLVFVVRDTVLALAAPQRRRAHLTGFLLSAAALLASVQACAAAAVAIGSTPNLRLAEQLYAWHVTDSLPLLAIPENLAWTRPVIAVGSADRAILVALTVALVVPLVRMVVSVYHLTGTAIPHRGGGVRAPSIPVLSRLARTGITIPLVVSGGFIWGGTRGPIGALSGLAFAAAVVATTAVAVGTAVLLSIVMGVLKAAWEPISDGPWMQLVLAAGLVWIDTPARHVLLPASESLAAPWKFAVMLGLWAVLTVLLLPVWVDPQLPESLLALVLLLGFAATVAPGSQRVTAALDVTVGGFALGPAVAAALAGLTGAYLVHLVSRAPARAANADGSHLGSMDLRHELAGYAYIGLQVVIAAAGLLMLLCGLGVVGVSSPMDAPRSLAATAWHVADALPGDLPATAGWRLAADFTGPWAGAVFVLTAAALIVVVVFPITRATARWARDRAGRSAPGRPLADVPESILADLTAVRAFLTGPPDDRLDAGPAVEARIAAAEADRRKLRQLVGEESPVYWAADQAISGAAEAYRKMVHASPGRWSLLSPQQAGTVDAVSAIDVYAAAVERWQMGEDVVAEIESRLRSLESREDGVQLRESEASTQQRVIDAREQGVDAREQMLVVRINATQTREQTVEIRAAAVEAREQETQTRERALDTRERSVATREADIDLREPSVIAREEECGARERSVETREQSAELREHDVDEREQAATTREREADERERIVETRAAAVQVREVETGTRQRDIELREQDIAAREQGIGTRQQSIDMREQNADAREREITAREEDAKAREQDVGARERRTAGRAQEVAEREHWVQAREQNAEIREESVVARERNAAAREREIEARDREVGADRAGEAAEPKPIDVTGGV